MANQYWNARQALLALDPVQTLAPNWGQYFLPLDELHLRAPVRNKAQPSEGRTEYAWIWIAPRPPPLPSTLMGTPLSDPRLAVPAPKSSTPPHKTLDADSQDFDHVQWAKCQARAEQYEEEVQLTVCQSHSTLRLPTCYERLLALSNPCRTLPVGCSLVHRGRIESTINLYPAKGKAMAMSAATTSLEWPD